MINGDSDWIDPDEIPEREELNLMEDCQIWSSSLRRFAQAAEKATASMDRFARELRWLEVYGDHVQEYGQSGESA